jgi:hypothetical protein
MRKEQEALLIALIASFFQSSFYEHEVRLPREMGH